MERGAYSEIDFHVIRDGKKIYEQQKLRNIIGSNLLKSNSWSEGLAIYNIWLSDLPLKELLDGTHSQSGNIISRVTGTHDFTTPNYTGDNLYVWADGTTAGYSDSNNLSITSIPVSTSQTKSAQELYRYNVGQQYEYSNAYKKDVGYYSTSIVNPVKDNDDLVFQMDPTETTISAQATSNYDLKQITLFQSYIGNPVRSFHYELPTPVPLVVGDHVVINSFNLRISWANGFAPRALPICPISGITTSCVVQRLTPVDVSEFAAGPANTPSQMYLVQTPNAWTIPTIPPYTASSYTNSVLTLPQQEDGDFVTRSAVWNGMKRETLVTFTHTVASTLTDVKQIFFGTYTSLHAVIEFDTPQTITAGKVITFNTTQSLSIAVPIP